MLALFALLISGSPPVAAAFAEPATGQFRYPVPTQADSEFGRNVVSETKLADHWYLKFQGIDDGTAVFLAGTNHRYRLASYTEPMIAVYKAVCGNPELASYVSSGRSFRIDVFHVTVAISEKRKSRPVSKCGRSGAGERG